MAKRLIFSDLHFGSPHCSLRRKVVVDGLNKFLNEIGPVDEIIFAGDILDANISTLTIAMEGVRAKEAGAWPRQLGFRKWLSIIFKLKNFSAKKIIYIPGNHDYVIWNLLAT